MTPQQLKAMKLALGALEDSPMSRKNKDAIDALRDALADHAMRETQRLGQEIEQKIGCVNHDCDQCKAQRTEQNFCSRCGKRTADLTTIHTCTPPKENT